VNGVTFTFNYYTDSNQINSVVATVSGGANLTTTYLRDSADKSRINRVGVGGSLGEIFSDAIGGFNQQDQITSRTITRKDANDDGTLANSQAIASTYGYNPSLGDALTSVTTTVNGVASTGYSYGFDNVGNFTGNSTLGTASNVNQYSGLTYNSRGDVTDDGTYAYSYDANDRLIVVTPHDTAQLELKYGYDSQGRRLWKTAYTYTGGAWAPSYSRHYLWDGNNLVAELDGSNAILMGYTWGPTGLLAVTDYTASGGPKTYVVAQDLSGNIAALVDPTNGMPVASYRYDPYGGPVSATGPKKTLSAFRGKGNLVDPEAPDDAFAPNPNGDGSDRVVDLLVDVELERDPAGESATQDLYQPLQGDPINENDPSGETAQQAWGYINSLPANVKGSVKTILGVQFDGTIPSSTQYGLIAQDEPYRQYIDQAVSLNQQALDTKALYDSLKAPNGSVSALSLIQAGRSLAPTDTISSSPLAPSDIAQYVALGQSQGNLGLPAHAGGYTDAFGWHMSFCMSCHDLSDRGAQLQMGATVNSNWGLITAAQMLPMLLPWDEIGMVMQDGALAAEMAEVSVPSMEGATFGAPQFRSLSAASNTDALLNSTKLAYVMSDDLAAEQAAMRQALGEIRAEAIANGDPVPGVHEPGPFAGEGVPIAKGVSTRSKVVVDAVNAEGEANGCHICGAREPGTVNGNWIKDHIPSTSLARDGTQVLYPSCQTCSDEQGWLVRNLRALQTWFSTIGK